MADTGRKWFVQRKMDPHPCVQVYRDQNRIQCPTHYIPRSWLSGVVGQWYCKMLLSIQEFSDRIPSWRKDKRLVVAIWRDSGNRAMSIEKWIIYRGTRFPLPGLEIGGLLLDDLQSMGICQYSFCHKTIDYPRTSVPRMSTQPRFRAMKVLDHSITFQPQTLKSPTTRIPHLCSAHLCLCWQHYCLFEAICLLLL